MTETPDWISNTPSTPGIHTDRPDANSEFTTPFPSFKLFGFVAQLIEGILKQVVGAIVGVFTPGISAFAQLAHWAVVLLPAQILEPLSALVALLVTILDSVPIIGPPIGDAVEDFAALLGLMKTNTDAAQATGEVAQGSANTANVGVAILNARVNEVIVGGASLSDTFSRNGSDLGPDYTLKYGSSITVLDNSGSGSVGTTTANSGTTTWASSGFLDRTYVAINTATAMATVRHRMSLVINQFTYGFFGNQANAYLIGRADAGLNNFVIAILGNLDVSGPGTCEVGYVVSNVYTRLGSQVSITTSDGDLWDFEVGTASDDYQFRLLQNNSPRVDQTDSGHSSHKDSTPGTTYKYSGFGEDCRIDAGPFGTSSQGPPPDIQVFAAADF